MPLSVVVISEGSEVEIGCRLICGMFELHCSSVLSKT